MLLICGLVIKIPLFWMLFNPSRLHVYPQMGEMEISRGVAERSLREHMGNVVEALIALTNWTVCLTLDVFLREAAVIHWTAS